VPPGGHGGGGGCGGKDRKDMRPQGAVQAQGQG
jgi:hypothetical protein